MIRVLGNSPLKHVKSIARLSEVIKIENQPLFRSSAARENLAEVFQSGDSRPQLG